MNKLLLSLAVLGAFLAYSVYKNPSLINLTSRVVPVETVVPGEKTHTPLASIRPSPSATPIAPPTPRGKYKDGVYTGPVADAFYGPLQVKVIVTGGKITDVQFLQYPNDRQTSIQINAQAMPMLEREAIAAQSAKVDGVSGATQTSKAFIESLNSALKQAI
jgi:uncharacterized protein with FMN-binding domain